MQNVELNEIYPAIVLKAKAHGLVLSFFNNIEGFVPLKEYNFEITQKYRDNPSEFFYSGQVVSVKFELNFHVCNSSFYDLFSD